MRLFKIQLEVALAVTAYIALGLILRRDLADLLSLVLVAAAVIGLYFVPELLYNRFAARRRTEPASTTTPRRRPELVVPRGGRVRSSVRS
jgi:hypothetical protein